MKNRILVMATLWMIGYVANVGWSQSTASAPAIDPATKTGLILHEADAYPGYTLLAPIPSKKTYLLDLDGRVVHQWESEYRPALAAYLLPNGHLLRTGMEAYGDMRTFRTGGAGGRVQEFDWDGKLLWDFRYISDDYQLHHDIKPLPNGHVLMIAWEKKTMAQAIAAGRNPKLPGAGELPNMPDADALWVDKIIEVQPTGKNSGQIIWEWHTWDHLIQHQDQTKPNYGVAADHPELVDLNFAARHGPMMISNNPDWTHFNSIDYNPKLDQIMVSVHSMGEIWIIDHSTTTTEAAGHSGGHSGKGGDFLYRWGNPEAYGVAGKRKLYGQHSAGWIEPGLTDAGCIMVFNNGERRPEGQFSSVELWAPPLQNDGSYLHRNGLAFGPDQVAWIYTAQPPTGLFSRNISGAQRLPNGNTLICSGANGIIFEINPQNKIVWKFIVPVGRHGPRFEPPRQIDGGLPGRPMRDPGAQGHDPVFRALRYALDYPGLAGKDLTPGAVLGANNATTQGTP